MTPNAQTPPIPERRKDPRRTVSIPAHLTLVGLTVEGRIENISTRGVSFVTANPHLKIHASNFVRIAFKVPSHTGDEVAVTRSVRITHVEPSMLDGAPARRLGLELDEAVVLGPDHGHGPGQAGATAG